MLRMLAAAGIEGSWESLRQILTVQRRVTSSLRRSDGRSVHVRKSTVAEPTLLAIYNALGVSALPGGQKADLFKKQIENSNNQPCLNIRL